MHITAGVLKSSCLASESGDSVNAIPYTCQRHNCEGHVLTKLPEHKDHAAAGASGGTEIAAAAELPFWQRKTLDEMNRDEWESLCDGCGRCCLLKLEDEDTAEIHLTRLSCKLLDVGTCRCSDYSKRHVQVPDCVAIDPAKVRALSWLPATCGYRLIDEGQPLNWWHPLVSGSAETVHQAGISVRGWALNETRVKAEHVHRYIIRDFKPAKP
jgi:uncharacterized protein